MRNRKRSAQKRSDTTLRHSDIGDTMVHVRVDVVPTEAQVRALAYEIYRARCDRGEQGDELADWSAAESELRHGGRDGTRAIRRSAQPGTGDASALQIEHAEAVS